MAWGPLIALILRALPDLLFLWRKRVENGEKERLHEDVQEFRAAIFESKHRGHGDKSVPATSLDLDRAAVLLEQRVREARYLRQQRS